jgi:hypothetical protein
MKTQTLARVIITVSVLSTAVVSVLVDFNSTHLFNPSWPGHARFHDAAMLNLLCFYSAVALWLMWRRSAEPDIGVIVATSVPVSFWSCFYWITTAIPGTSLAIGAQGPPTLAGVPVYPNVALGTVEIAIALAGYALYRRARRQGP